LWTFSADPRYIGEKVMPRLAPKELKLEAKEREHLEKLINRHTTEQQIALMAKIVLLADEGENNREIARK
jgi:putative transposase